MGSLYLHALSPEARKDLEKKLLSTQNGKCFICEKIIDPALHAGQIDIDHVEPIKHDIIDARNWPVCARRCWNTADRTPWALPGCWRRCGGSDRPVLNLHPLSFSDRL